MEVNQSHELFLIFLKTQINRNININEEDLLNDFSNKHELNIFRESNRIIFKNIYLLEYLRKFIEDPHVSEIILHDHQNLQIENKGRLINREISEVSESIYLLSLETFALKNKVIWNFSNPFASFYSKIRSFSFRASLIHESCSPTKKSKFFLRRIKDSPFSLHEFGICKEEEEELTKLVLMKKNILLAGSAGSGKSSLLATLLQIIPESEHVIILEDTHEIIPLRKNFTHFLGNELLQNKSLKEYCAYSMRLRPDRITLGEIRSSEIIPFVLAMNTGHRGMISTIHADSGVDAIYRMALLFLIHGNNQAFSYEMAIKLMSKNIDIVVFLKDKKIKEIIKIIGTDRGVVNYDYIFKNNLS
jgi:Flp pilus assembly CpaF family ATPase